MDPNPIPADARSLDRMACWSMREASSMWATVKLTEFEPSAESVAALPSDGPARSRQRRASVAESKRSGAAPHAALVSGLNSMNEMSNVDVELILVRPE